MTNIILITVDSLRYDHLSCCGYERTTTPNIDRIADGGSVFENAFAHAGSTKFSFPSILSSTYAPMYNGVGDMENRMLVSEVLSSNGYSTAGFHSNPFLNLGYSAGFDRFRDPKDNPSKLSRLRQFIQRTLPHDGITYNVIKSLYNSAERFLGSEIGSAYEDAESMTSLAMEWVDEQTDDNWFLWLHYMDPHHPYLPPSRFRDEFCGREVSDEDAIELRRKMLKSPDSVSEAEKTTIIDLYDAEIGFVDEQIGRLLKYVDDTAEKTDVMITADHGEEFGENGEFSHGTCREACIHVPLIIERSETEEAQRPERLAGLVDISPTILDMAGIEPPAQYLGTSLLRKNQDRSRIIGGWVDKKERVVFCRDHEYKGVLVDDEEILFRVAGGVDSRANEEFPTVISEGITEFVSYIGENDSEQDVDESAKERLEQLGYLE